MRDQLKNEFLLLLNMKLSSDDLRVLSTQLDLILANYEISPRNTELIPYGSDIPKTVEVAHRHHLQQNSITRNKHPL